MSTELLIQILLGVLLVCWSVGAHNRLVRLKNAVGKEFVHIDVQLRLRQDLFDSLIALKDGLDAEVLEDLDAAVRAQRHALDQLRLQPSGGPQALALQQADQALDAPLARLWQCSRTQDAAAADPLLRQMVFDLAHLGSRLEVVAEPYNLAVRHYNEAAQEFPAWLIAKLAGLRPLSGLHLGQHPAAREAARPLMVGRRDADNPQVDLGL